MHVHDAPAEMIAERRRELPHESGQADQIDLMALQMIAEGEVQLIVVGILAAGDGDGRHTPLRGAIQSRSVRRGAEDDRDLARNPAIRTGIENRLKVGAASFARQQNAYADRPSA